MSVSSFRIDVPDAVLDDLRARLARTRFTDRSGNQPWQGGVDPDYLRDLVSYWHDGFDWRAREAELNAYPQHLALVGGRKLHFLHVRAARPAGTPAPLPLILSHGWPSSFVEMLPLVDRLTSPAGGGFDVVVPSLPGFGFSEVPDEPVTRALLARTLHELMTDVLGYERYGAFGGDVGGVVTGWLGALYPEQVAGIHMIHPPFPASFDARPLSPAEQAFLDAEAAYDETDGGYSAIMGTRPDTLAAALADSPAGLAAWIVDKYRDWSDNHGDLANSIDTGHPAHHHHALLGHRHHRLVVPAVRRLRPQHATTRHHRAGRVHGEHRTLAGQLPPGDRRAGLHRHPALERTGPGRALHAAGGAGSARR